jgi:hypothetical protein
MEEEEEEKNKKKEQEGKKKETEKEKEKEQKEKEKEEKEKERKEKEKKEKEKRYREEGEGAERQREGGEGGVFRLWARPWIEPSITPAILRRRRRRRRMGRRGRRSILTRDKTFDSGQDLESSPQDQWRYNQQQYLIFLHGHSSTDSRCALSSSRRRRKKDEYFDILGQTTPQYCGTTYNKHTSYFGIANQSSTDGGEGGRSERDIGPDLSRSRQYTLGMAKASMTPTCSLIFHPTK